MLHRQIAQMGVRLRASAAFFLLRVEAEMLQMQAARHPHFVVGQGKDEFETVERAADLLLVGWWKEEVLNILHRTAVLVLEAEDS